MCENTKEIAEKMAEIYAKKGYQTVIVDKFPEVVKPKECTCQIFTGGEIYHHKNCVHYPESISKIIDEARDVMEETANFLKSVWPSNELKSDIVLKSIQFEAELRELLTRFPKQLQNE